MIVLLFPARWLPTMMTLLGVTAILLCPLSTRFLDPSAHGRIITWGLANQVFKSNLLFGLGYGQFWMVTGGKMAAHNMFVSCYTEIGLFGYFFWFGLILFGLMGTWRTRVAMAGSHSSDDVWLFRFSGAAVASMAGFCAGGYFLSRATVYPLYFLMGILAAIPLVAEQMRAEDGLRLTPSPRRVLTVGGIGAVGSIFYIYVSLLVLNKAFGG
jgi:O-antigen ligase